MMSNISITNHVQLYIVICVLTPNLEFYIRTLETRLTKYMLSEVWWCQDLNGWEYGIVHAGEKNEKDPHAQVHLVGERVEIYTHKQEQFY